MVSLMGREYAQQALLGHSCPFWKECCPRSSTHWGSANHEPPRPFLSKSSDVGEHSLGKYAGQTQVRGTPVGLLTLSTLPAPRQRGSFFTPAYLLSTGATSGVPAARSTPTYSIGLTGLSMVICRWDVLAAKARPSLHL